MSEPIVQKQPAVQSNPFAKHAADHVSAGTVAIESERAIAEAQGKLVIAKRFPRNQAVAYANIIDACRRPGLAEEACYSFPRGGEVVSGPAIRLAEMLAANWGNVDYGIRELSRKEGVSEMEAYCWDLETNTMSSQKFTVRHIRDKRGGSVTLTDERDIYELTANMGARRLRARILAILPADLVQAAVDQCSKTLATGGDIPIQDRIRKMVVAFKVLGIPSALIEKRLGHPLDTTSGEELADLTKIHNSLRDNMSRVTDWFGDGPKSGDEDQIEGDPRPEPPAPRKRRGVSAEPVETAPASAPASQSPEPQKPTTPLAPSARAVADEAKPVVAPDPVAKAKADKLAEKEPEPVKEAPKPEVPASRAFLNDKETLVTTIKVKEVSPMGIKREGVIHPSVQIVATGGFVGTIYHVGGGKEIVPAIKNEAGETTTAAVYAPNAPWVAGAELKVTILGKHNPHPKVNKVQHFVQAVEAVAPAVEQLEEF